MLEEDEVVVGPRRRDRIPHLLRHLLKVVGFGRDLKDTGVGLADLGVRQRSAELAAGLQVALRRLMQHEHRDLVS